MTTDLPTPIEKQSRRANKHVFQLESKWKKKWETLSEMTKIVKDFMEVSKARHLANERKKQTAFMNIDESFGGGGGGQSYLGVQLIWSLKWFHLLHSFKGPLKSQG